MFCGGTEFAPRATLKTGGRVGFTTSKGELETYSVTGISKGLLTAATPVAVTVAATVTLPVHVPAGSPVGFTETVSCASVEPVTGTPPLPFSTIQLDAVQLVWTAVAVKLSGEPVLEVIFSSCPPGTAWPIWNGKDIAP